MIYIIAGLLVLLFVFWVAHEIGYDKGRKSGYGEGLASGGEGMRNIAYHHNRKMNKGKERP
jgi:hypothetical protein